MKRGIQLRKTVKNERFLIRAKIKTIKVGDAFAIHCKLTTSPILTVRVKFYNNHKRTTARPIILPWLTAWRDTGLD